MFHAAPVGVIAVRISAIWILPVLHSAVCTALLMHLVKMNQRDVLSASRQVNSPDGRDQGINSLLVTLIPGVLF
jgi:hypothetical protein